MNYLKYQVSYKQIYQLLNKKHYKNINFFIDLPSISRGFYNANLIHNEISRYVEERTLPTLFIEESKQFYNNLYKKFAQYNPKFITFYDSGRCQQNIVIDSSYKADRIASADNLLLENEELELFRKIKQYYLTIFPEEFNKAKLSLVITSDTYELDLIPYIFLENDLINCNSKSTLNIILSTDKDLLQCCRFKNTIQCATLYSKKSKQLLFYVLNNENALSYIYKKFKIGLLTANTIPMILALMGDKADNISGIKGVGPAKACQLMVKYKQQLSKEIHEHISWPEELQPHIKQIIKNYKLISFEEQVKRIPKHVIDDIKYNSQMLL